MLTDADVRGAVELVDRIRAAWTAATPQPLTVCAGVAAVGDDGTAAVLEADRGMSSAHRGLVCSPTSLAVSSMTRVRRDDAG